MTNHYKIVCDCGNIVEQCRCPGPKEERHVLVCDKCRPTEHKVKVKGHVQVVDR